MNDQFKTKTSRIQESASREYAESIIDTVREPLIILDQDLRVVTASHSFYEFFKVKPEETERQLIYNLGNKQWDIPKLRELLEDILPKEATFDNYEVEHDFADIGKRIMLLNARQIQRASGKERIILLAIEDITERKEIEAGLEKTRKELEVIKQSEDEAREYSESMIDTVREPLIVLDQDLRVVTASRSFYEVFKVKPKETERQLIYNLGNKQWDIPKLRELLETILPQKTTFDNYEVEHDFVTIGRRIMLLNARQIQRVLGKKRIILLAIEDITERKKAEEALRESEHRYQELSIIDDLTQLYNSRHFHAQLEREIERSNRYEQPLTLLMLDLDKFKKFNDKYGHVEGDYVLSQFGQVIKQCLRETDSAYRYGGEEFTIILPMTAREEGIVTTKRIQTELRKKCFSPVLGQEVYITVSIGLSQYKPKEEIKAFVHRIDHLMYQAKKNGRDRIYSES